MNKTVENYFNSLNCSRQIYNETIYSTFLYGNLTTTDCANLTNIIYQNITWTDCECVNIHTTFAPRKVKEWFTSIEKVALGLFFSLIAFTGIVGNRFVLIALALVKRVRK